MHLHLVAHPKKQRDESNAPNKKDVAGSGKITDGADNVFSVWAAQKDEGKGQADDGDPDGLLELQKQRNGETQRIKQYLWFDKPTMQYRTQPRKLPLQFFKFNPEGNTNGGFSS